MFPLLLMLPAEQLIAHFQAFRCKRIQHQTGLFSTFCFIAHNCRKGLLPQNPGQTGWNKVGGLILVSWFFHGCLVGWQDNAHTMTHLSRWLQFLRIPA